MSGRASASLRMALAGAALLLSAVPVARLSAQNDPRLVAAVQLAREGLGDSARAITRGLLARTAPTDSLYPEILLTQATVAATASERQRTLQRIVIEYASSPWADDALLQLAQLEYATGNLAGAARQLERLRADYPATPLLSEASLWAARTYFDQKQAAQACGWLRAGLARVGDNVELANQLSYYNQRCSGVPVATGPAGAPGTPAETTAAPSATPREMTSVAKLDAPAKAAPPQLRDTGTPVAKRAPVYRVQVAALSPIKAERTVELVKRQVARFKYPVTTLDTGQGVVKIRVGAFPTRAAAQAALPRIRAEVGGQPFIVQDP